MNKRLKHRFYFTFAAPAAFVTMIVLIVLLVNPLPPIILFGTLTLVYLLLGFYHLNHHKQNRKN
ncbi:hypothetical protein ACE1TF_04655 [Geomicrobium sp. JSM 1781026]|uniref:hypothetical protein n=1 Tax=Geomicrobium sp. JSM 1781026 TaxID=3344580 RepID=UPI0035BFD8DC